MFRSVSGTKIDEFSGMVLETLRISSQDFLGRWMKIRFRVSANATIGMSQSVVLDSYSGKTARRLEEFVGFSHTNSITQS